MWLLTKSISSATVYTSRTIDQNTIAASKDGSLVIIDSESNYIIIRGLNNHVILIRKVTNTISLLIENCHDCLFVFHCLQLRINSCNNIILFGCVLSRPLLDGSFNIYLAAEKQYTESVEKAIVRSKTINQNKKIKNNKLVNLLDVNNDAGNSEVNNCLLDAVELNKDEHSLDSHKQLQAKRIQLQDSDYLSILLNNNGTISTEDLVFSITELIGELNKKLT